MIDKAELVQLISLGAGVQSSTMALMAAAGEITPMPKAAIFADTQDEPASVYRWLDWLEKQLPFPVVRVSKGQLSKDATTMRISKKGSRYSRTSIPFFTLSAQGELGKIPHRSCTADYKIKPIMKAARKLAGVKRGEKNPVVAQWIGISMDEIPRMKRSGEVGLHDFRGMNIRLAERAGLVFEYDWVVRKNPQAQAIRTRSRELQFSGLEADRVKSRGTLPDYLLKFRVPGDNAVPIRSDGVSRNDWIAWAECCWSDIKETDTLNVKEGRGDDDTKHICPLQLGVIDRLVRLYTNDDEIVFSPFTGIGSEGYQSVKRGRRFYGCEIKDEYFKAAQANLRRAEQIVTTENKLLFA